jgi:hypothetical protein
MHQDPHPNSQPARREKATRKWAVLISTGALIAGAGIAALLSSSGQAASPPPALQPAANQPAATQPPAIQPAATQPAATQPPANQPAATQPPASQPAATQPPTTSNCVQWPGVPDLIGLGGDLNSLAQDEGDYGDGSSETSADAGYIGVAVNAVSNDGPPPAQYASQLSYLLQTVTAEGDDPGAFGAGYDGSLATSLANEMSQVCD